MSAFALDKNYQQFNFDEISVDELQIISGGSGGIFNDRCLAAIGGGALLGGVTGFAGGGIGAFFGAIGGGLLGYGSSDACG